MLFCWLHEHLIVCLTISMKTILYIKFTLIDVYIHACSIVLVLCICLFTFQPMSRDSQMSIQTRRLLYTPLFVRFFPHIRQPMLFGLSTAQYQCTFFLITFCCFCFIFHLRFSHTNCFMLAHCWSLSCSNFNFSRLFFL